MSSSKLKKTDKTDLSQLSARPLSTITVCVDCAGLLQYDGSKFSCCSCMREFKCERGGVWDFRAKENSQSLPSIFEEKEFKRWLKIFREQESKNWAIYSNWFFRFISQAGHRILGKKINKAITSDALVLEIGAGTGALLEQIPADNFVAVDTSFESLETLKSRWPEATCVCASASILPFGNKSFDQVVSLHTLEHLYFIAEALEEMIRVMRIQGDMHYVIPTEGGWGFLLGRKLITGPHLRKKYELDVQYVMDREHINDAPRVLKFLRMYFATVEQRYWPLSFLKILTPNAMIYGKCSKPFMHEGEDDGSN